MNEIINLHDYVSKADVSRDVGPNWQYMGLATEALGGLEGSVLATPWALGEAALGIAGLTPLDATARYREWLWAQMQDRDAGVLEALWAIGRATVLACWCEPPCYGLVIARAAAWLRHQAAAASPSAEDGGETPNSAPGRKSPLPTRSQPTAYLGDTPHRCAWHPKALLRTYRLLHIGIVHAHRLPNGTWCAVVPRSARAA